MTLSLRFKPQNQYSIPKCGFLGYYLDITFCIYFSNPNEYIPRNNLLSKSTDYATTFYMAGSFFVAAGVISEVAHLIYISKEKHRNIASLEEEKMKQWYFQ